MTTTVLHALALLASLGAAVVVLVVALWSWCWCWFRWLDVETFGPRGNPLTALTTEPDPTESAVVDPPIGFGFSELAPPILDIKNSSIVPALPVMAWVHAEGALPVPFNPVGPSLPGVRIRS